MPHLTTDDGVKLYYEETGKGIPVVFIHEFAGDYRSWEMQVRYFARYYRCITVNARGYPPSDVPKDGTKYSQERARDDIRAVLDALKIDKAHIVGLSMGGFAALHFGFTYPDRARSLVIAGCGYGAEPAKRAQFAADRARFRATGKRSLHEQATLRMARIAQIVRGTKQHLFDGGTRGRLLESAGPKFGGQFRVAIQNLVEKLFLITEGGIHAGAVDAHGFGKRRERCALISALPKNAQGAVQSLVRVEGTGAAQVLRRGRKRFLCRDFPGLQHSVYPSGPESILTYQSVRNAVAALAPRVASRRRRAAGRWSTSTPCASSARASGSRPGRRPWRTWATRWATRIRRSSGGCSGAPPDSRRAPIASGFASRTSRGLSVRAP